VHQTGERSGKDTTINSGRMCEATRRMCKLQILIYIWQNAESSILPVACCNLSYFTCNDDLYAKRKIEQAKIQQSTVQQYVRLQ
jgi:hypothetical protein